MLTCFMDKIGCSEFSRDAYLWNASQQNRRPSWCLMIKVLKMEKFQKPCLEYIRQRLCASFILLTNKSEQSTSGTKTSLVSSTLAMKMNLLQSLACIFVPQQCPTKTTKTAKPWTFHNKCLFPYLPRIFLKSKQESVQKWKYYKQKLRTEEFCGFCQSLSVRLSVSVSVRRRENSPFQH